MKIELLAAGTKPAKWIQEGVTEYQKRMPRACKLEIREIEIAKRVKTGSVEGFKIQEEKRIRRLIKKGALIVSLDAGGTMMSTEDLARKLERWMSRYDRIQMMIGGPDGLSRNCLSIADESWSLSQLTFPHFIVRILVAEQLYRAWSYLNNHPYHK